MEQSLQILTPKRPSLSLSQNNLLKIMVECVRTNEALTFDQLVRCYSESVNEEIYYRTNIWRSGLPFTEEYHNVLQAYKEQSWIWNYKIKGLIKSWFVSAIGLLVIKGKLRVLPNIEIEN